MRMTITLIVTGIMLMSSGCKKPVTQLLYDNPDSRVIFLHHSTGRNVWYGDVAQQKFYLRESTCMVPRLLKEYNDKTGKKINIQERYFPSGSPYAWKNYPFDYYNIWVKNAGETPFMEEPTLEMLTQDYDIIIFKHCFPVSRIVADDNNPEINSEVKTLANYKLQYEALRAKLNQFPQTSFIVWTGAALVESQLTVDEAKRAEEFYNWTRESWDVPGDNIELFDFRALETGGDLYLKPDYSVGIDDSHPNISLSTIAAEALVNKIIEVIEMKN